ncbi:MAG: GDSL-type esterase/lipase family protein [Gemmatimonadaceae bacterium]
MRGRVLHGHAALLAGRLVAPYLYHIAQNAQFEHVARPATGLPQCPRSLLRDSDLAAGRTPEQVAADYSTFVAFVRRTLPRTRVADVSIKPSPSRWTLVASMRRANALIAAQIERSGSDAYVDVSTPMLGPDGRQLPSLFLADSLHMTPAGYTIWRARVAPLVH